MRREQPAVEPLSPNARNVAICPFCRELITKGAVRCPHCHAELKIPSMKKKRPFWLRPFMLGFYTATIIWIIALILYFHK